MGQHSKWLPQQLSQSIFNSSENISSNYNFASNNNFNATHIPNGYVNGIAEHTIHNNKTVVSSSSLSSPLLSASSKDGLGTIDTFPNQIFQSFAQQQIHNFSESIVEKLSDALQLALLSEQKLNGTTITTSTLTSNANANENNANNGDDISITSNYLMLLLIILYVVIVIGGVFGNASLIITLYTQSSGRLRNPLLVALCLADLMVTGVSAPLTIVTLMLMARNGITSTIVCKLIYFMQSVPVAASTISLLMLSLDRYATVKHPRLAQLRQRRFLPAFLAIVSWISAICVSIPILLGEFSKQTFMNSTTIKLNQTTNSPIELNTSQLLSIGSDFKSNEQIIASNGSLVTSYGYNQTIPEAKIACQSNFGPTQMPSIYLTIYTLFVFILPGIGVIMNHLGVHQKLCALSLTARAAHGELPLPMPIMRRPTHMIIVTGMANAAAVRDDEDSTNDGDNQQKDERRHMMDSTRLKPTPRTPRSLRYGHSIRSHAHNTKNAAPSEFPLPQTSTLRSRRRLANILVAGSFVFIFCWSPHVICLIYTTLSAGESYSKTVANYSLLLGYTHSALNPILHWVLNQNSLRQSSFLSRLTSVQRFMRAHFHERNHQPPPSSTNEAALGPFNPRYIKARPQQYAPPASSHYMY